MTLTKTFKGMPDREARKVVEEAGEVVKSFTFGPYTVVKVVFKTEGKTVVGYGQSRRSPGDNNKEVTGFSRAKNNAVRSIVSKCKGQFPHHLLQG